MRPIRTHRALKPALAASLILTGCAGVVAAPGAAPERNEADPEFWRAEGQAALAMARAPASGEQARNVIFFVGDGMGVSTVTAARILAGQMRGQNGEEHLLSFEQFPHVALSKTYNTNQQTPDSAGTMTAMITGVKTLAGVISVDGSVTRGDCASSLDAAVPTLIEQAEDAGLATGVISTARITHATPAATYAHAPERNWEADSTMAPAALAAGCQDIAAQLLSFDHGDGIEVVLGGGRVLFLPTTATDPEYPVVAGRRGDGRNLIQEWQQAHPGGHYVWNTDQFSALPADGGKVLGLFEPSHMQWEADRADDAGGEPSLAEMTRVAIERLSTSDEGYVLVVEAGRIDHGHHAANAYRALTDTVALSDAVAVADALTSADDTLIVVTADHSHTMTIAGYPTRGNPILGLVVTNDATGTAMDTPMTDALGLPFTTLGYANGAGYDGKSDTQPQGPKRFPHQFASVEPGTGRSDLTEVDTSDSGYLQEGAVPMVSETHGGEDVAIYARGPGAHLLGGVVEQNVIYYLLENALSDSLGESE